MWRLGSRLFCRGPAFFFLFCKFFFILRFRYFTRQCLVICSLFRLLGNWMGPLGVKTRVLTVTSVIVFLPSSVSALVAQTPSHCPCPAQPSALFHFSFIFLHFCFSAVFFCVSRDWLLFLSSYVIWFSSLLLRVLLFCVRSSATKYSAPMDMFSWPTFLV